MKSGRINGSGPRFSRFSTVGLINAVVDLTALNLLLIVYSTRDPLMLALYNGFALVLANTNSYVLNTLWTFRERADHGLRQKTLFALQALVNVGLSNALFWIGVRGLLDYTYLSTFASGNIAKIFSTSIASALSYFILRYLVFTKERRIRGLLKRKRHKGREQRAKR